MLKKIILLKSVIGFIITHPLNNKQKFRAACRFFYWQIYLYLKESKIYNWINGSKFNVKKGETGLTGNIYCGLHEFNDMIFLLHFIRENDLFIDVGANSGSYTILSSAVRKAFSISFEPISSTFLRLENNIKINSIENKVEIKNIGIGKKEEFKYFTTEYDTCNRIVDDENNHHMTTQIKIDCLDKLLLNKNPTFLKIDTEGYELDVLMGSKNILKLESLKVIIIELKLKHNAENECHNILIENNFLPYLYDPYERKVNEFDMYKHESNNILYIRDKEFVLNRLKTSEKFSVLNQLI